MSMIGQCCVDDGSRSRGRNFIRSVHQRLNQNLTKTILDFFYSYILGLSPFEHSIVSLAAFAHCTKRRPLFLGIVSHGAVYVDVVMVLDGVVVY